MATKKAPQKKSSAPKKASSAARTGAAKKTGRKESGVTIAKATKAVGQAVSSAGSALGSAVKAVLPVSLGGESAKVDTPYLADVVKLAKGNENFRQVLFTTELSQLVLMSIPVGGEIGSEIHSGIDQVLSIVEGEGESILNSKKDKVATGSVIVVPAGTRHNFVNTGALSLKLYTIYAPPDHAPGTVHRTKAEAEADKHDSY